MNIHILGLLFGSISAYLLGSKDIFHYKIANFINTLTNPKDNIIKYFTELKKESMIIYYSIIFRLVYAILLIFWLILGLFTSYWFVYLYLFMGPVIINKLTTKNSDFKKVISIINLAIIVLLGIDGLFLAHIL